MSTARSTQFNSGRYNLKIPTKVDRAASRGKSQKLEVFIIRTSQMFM